MAFNLFDENSLLGDVPLNPYVYGQALSEPPEFVGRKPELRLLSAAARNSRGGVILVRGDFRIGKSSILRRFEREIRRAPQEPKDARCRRIECHAFSCEQLVLGRSQSILGKLSSLLGGDPTADPNERSGAILTLAEKAASVGCHPVFLIDEIGLLPRVEDAGIFIEILRRLVSEHPLHFILAGAFGLQDPRMDWSKGVTDEPGTREDFHRALDRVDQVTETVQVQPFHVGDAVELIRLSETVAGTSFSLRGHEETVLDLAGTIPYVIQVVCSKLYELLYEDPQHRLDADELDQLRRYLSRTPREVHQGRHSEAYVDGESLALSDERLNALKQRVYDQLADPYFDPLWYDLLDDEERRTLSETQGGIPMDEVSWRSAAFRLRERGYLRERGAHLWIFSGLFEEYLDRRHRDRRGPVAPPLVSLRLADDDREDLGDPSVVPARFLDRLKELADTFSDLADGEPSLEYVQEYVELLAHLLALLSQLAVMTYADEPGLHKPELNSVLRRCHRQNQTLGMRLEQLRSILRLEKLHEDDILSRLRTSVMRRRDEDELPPAMVRLIREVTGTGRTRLSLMDFLESCVRLRNLQTHPEDRPSGVTADSIRRLIPLAAAGLHEAVGQLMEETRGLTLVAYDTAETTRTAGDSEGSASLQPVFTRKRLIARNPTRWGQHASRPHSGEMYPALFGTASDADVILLQASSLSPLIVDGATLRATCEDPDVEVQSEAVYVLMGTLRKGLRFAPFGDPRGDRVEVSFKGGDSERRLVEVYEAFVERLR